MAFVRIDLWPAGLVLAVAVVLIVAMRVLERYAHRAAVKRTRQALRQALSGTPRE
jgi:divalent metal cation (Fe/Co/Zn/Cd) transporter